MKEPTTIEELFNEVVNEYGDLPAFTCMGKTISYRQLDRLSAQLATYLQHHTTLAPGDRLAIQLPNLLQYPIVLFAALRTGLVVVNTNPLYTGRELEHQLQDSGAKVLVTFANLAQAAADVIDNTDVQQVIVTEVADCHGWFKRTLINGVVKYIHKAVPKCHFPSKISFRAALKLGCRDPFKPVKSDSSNLAFLQYTGGTTGVAKGAMLSHSNLLSNMNQIIEHWQDTLTERTDCFLAPLPMYHIYAFTLHCLVVMRLGCSNVLIPNPRDLPSVVKAFSTNPVTGIVGLNTLFVALCRNDEFVSQDFSKLRFTTSGGMALSENTAKRWQEVTGVLPMEGYGLTETSPVVSINQKNKNKLGTIGTPVPNTLVKIIDEKGHSVATNSPGELCIKGPQVMMGYWKRPEATAAVLDEEGWLKSGDIAVIDEDGFIKIVDRKKDMIIVSGFNVYPNEVESVLVSHPDIIEAAVISIPDEETGEAVKAFVVVEDRMAISEKDIKTYCREALTGYKVPRFIEFRDELPKSNVGKVLRRMLRDG